jgi:hypothetical protein
MKIKVGLSIGLMDDQRDTLEIPNEELEGLTPEQIEDVCEQWLNDWASNYLDMWFEVIEQ